MATARLGFLVLAIIAALARAETPPAVEIGDLAALTADPNNPRATSQRPARAPSIELDKPVISTPDTPPATTATAADPNEAGPTASEAPALAPQVVLDEPVIEEAAADAAPADAAPADAAPADAPAAAEPAPEPAVAEETDTPVVAAAVASAAPDPQEALPPEPPEPPEPGPEPVSLPLSTSLLILGTEVQQGTATRLSWSPSQTLEGIATPTPVLIVNGAEAGPTLCLTAAIHGDELNGIETVRRVLYNLDPESLRGAVIGVPIVNLQGFHRSSRYLADRRDLNRYFPGHPNGSSASRIAYSFFEEVIRHCDALVDLHTGSFHRTNMPQLRGDLRNPAVRALTEAFGNTVVLQSRGASGTLRRAAIRAGIPAVTLEAGESMRLQQRAVEHGVNGITTLMNKMGMIERFKLWGDPEPVYHRSLWVRAEQGGILFGEARLGDTVREGKVLGKVTDPITNISSEILAPRDGRVIGMALNQVVLPGYAAFHLAFATPKSEVEQEQLDFIEVSARRLGGPADETPTGASGAEDDAPPEEDPDAPDNEVDSSELPDTDDFDE